MDCRWEEGIWLGMADVSNELAIGTVTNCVRARDIWTFGSLADQWDTGLVHRIKG